jgi:hypothetical protein
MVVGATAVLAAGSAHAGNVHWSVGIHAPIAPGVALGTVISSRHGFPVLAPPAVVLPAPVVYAPPVYVAPPVYLPPVYAAPVYAPRVYAPRVVHGGPVWVGGRWVRGPVHGHPHAGGWHPRFDHRPAPVPARRPGREIRY